MSNQPWPWQHTPSFVATGTPVAHWLIAAGTSATYGTPIAYYGRGYGNWSMRVRLNGAASSGQVQFTGLIAGATSDATNAALTAYTTWDGNVNSSDYTVSVTGKPLTAVAPFVSTPSSSATSYDVWIAASA